MAVSVTNQRMSPHLTEDVEGQLGRTYRRIITGLFILLGLALAFPLFSLGRWMFSKDYYQHWPLLVIGAGVLAFFRWRSVVQRLEQELTFRVLFWLCLSVVLTATVFVLPSRWMASLAAVATMVAATNYFGGRRLAALMLGPIMLLAAAVPLPVGFDNWFVVALQNLATRLASYWLEFAGLMHFTTGVSIQTADQSYFVKDACSGIHSVFAAIAVGVGYGVYRKYSVVRVIFLLTHLLFWVVVANAMRVFLTVYGQSRLGLDLSNPTYHELLGMVTFACGVLLAISTDNFLRYLRPETDSEELTWEERLDRVPGRRLLDTPISTKFAVGLVGFVGVCGLLSSVLFFSYDNPDKEPLTLQQLADLTYVDLVATNESLLSDPVSNWTAIAFRKDERDKDNPFGGMVSLVWQYRHVAGRSVLVSLDGPYESWHDLGICYRGIGWTIEDMETVERSVSGEETMYACELTLKRDPIDTAQVLFACFDGTGDDIEPPKYFGNAFKGLVQRFGTGAVDQKEHPGGMIQVQVFDERPGPISEKDKEENRALFWEVVQQVLSAKK